MKKVIFITLLYLFYSESFSMNKYVKPIAGTIFASSFIPYFVDDSIKPECYKDGLSREEIKIKHKYNHLNKYLNGDINKLHDIFPDFDIKID